MVELEYPTSSIARMSFHSDHRAPRALSAVEAGGYADRAYRPHRASSSASGYGYAPKDSGTSALRRPGYCPKSAPVAISQSHTRVHPSARNRSSSTEIACLLHNPNRSKRKELPKDPRPVLHPNSASPFLVQ